MGLSVCYQEEGCAEVFLLPREISTYLSVIVLFFLLLPVTGFGEVRQMQGKG